MRKQDHPATLQEAAENFHSAASDVWKAFMLALEYSHRDIFLFIGSVSAFLAGLAVEHYFPDITSFLFE